MENKEKPSDQIYQDWLEEFPGHSPAAIETALTFIEVAAHFNMTQDSCFAEFGLTSGRFSLLLLLKKCALSPTELAKEAMVSKATMTQFIDGLEKDLLVKRVSNPIDRRCTKIQLTTKGEQILKRVMPTHLERLNHFEQVLNKSELKQLFSLLEKIAKSYQEQVD